MSSKLKGRPITPICGSKQYNWNDITCDKNGHVTKIAVRYRSLTGRIPESIGDLPYLEYLSFFRNHLTGPIPTSIGKLSSLTYISLQNNHLSGTLPTNLGQLSSLSELWMVSNSLVGPIPSQLGQATNLKFLELSNNFLTGTIPNEISNLRKLKVLHLDTNFLSGVVPSSLCLIKLSALYLYWVGNGDKGNTGLVCYPFCLNTIFDRKFGQLKACTANMEEGV